MNRFLKIGLVVFSVAAGVGVALVGISHWSQKQLGEIFKDMDLNGLEEDETEVIPEVKNQKS